MKYKHIPQKPYCCVPTCIQMVLHRRRLPTLSQSVIAYDLGVILPPEHKHLLPKSHIGRKPKSGWGTRIDIKKYSLDSFFKKRKYPLKEIFYSADKFLSVRGLGKFLSDNLKEGSDLLICFNHSLLYNKQGAWGHASLIESIKGNKATLRDPRPERKRARSVLLSKLFKALKNLYHGGIWVIKDC